MFSYERGTPVQVPNKVKLDVDNYIHGPKPFHEKLLQVALRRAPGEVAYTLNPYP